MADSQYRNVLASDKKMPEIQPTIFIIDQDHSIWSSGDIEALSGVPVKLYQSIEEFLEKNDSSHTGCLILEPDGQIRKAQEILRSKGCSLPTIIVTQHSDISLVRDSFRAGAVDYILKPFDTCTLLERVHEAISIDTATRDRRRRLESAKKRLSSLSARENQVLDLVIRGYPNKRIALVLEISISTVEFHKRNIMHKTSCHSIAEVMNLYFTRELSSSSGNIGRMTQ